MRPRLTIAASGFPVGGGQLRDLALRVPVWEASASRDRNRGVIQQLGDMTNFIY